ncbi:MAG TPA: AraC family transcriptional regulator [Tepidisphaeraceae bacterium]|nr:AraC family transcriptional regulator [Tepidisphaeraceae bacterium]
MPLACEPEKLPDFFSQQVRKARRFAFDGAPIPQVPLAVVGGGHEFCSPVYAIERPGFPYYSVELVVRGHGWLTLDGTGHALCAGSVFSYGPGIRHHIRTDPRDPLEKYFIDFTGPRAPQILREHRLAPGTAAQVACFGEIQDIFNNIIRDGLRGTGTSNVLCAALSEYLMIKLAELIASPGARPSPASATFQRCRQYIAANFRRLRSLEQIAGECDIDQAYLCRLFRRFDHPAPYQYLLRLKMNFAAEQLRDPKVLVKEVAASVGFQDPFHFSHAFKNVFGASPDVFRRLR